MATCIGCKQQVSPTVFVDPALAVLVPQDTSLLAGIRMQRIEAASSPSERFAQAPRLVNFRSRIGLPDDVDVWEYLLASNGRDWVTLMRGKFAEMGMEPRLKHPTAKRLSVDGIPVVGDEHGAVGFLNPTTAIAGKLGVVIRAIQGRNSTAGIPESLEKLRSLISSTNEVWFVSSGPLPDMFPVSHAISARGGFNVKSRKIDVIVEAASPATARAIAEAVGGRIEGSRAVANGPIRPDAFAWLLGTG